VKKASISELKNQLSAYLQSVRAGETVLILDRNEAIARIERVADENRDDRLARLHRSGVLTPPAQPLPLEILRQPVPRAAHSVLAALIEEREEGR
jgi:antitoxin (DNA-binding transcriptional repressor) of toxin-antitoxin stability system